MKLLITILIATLFIVQPKCQEDSKWNLNTNGYIKSLNGAVYNSEISSIFPYITDNLLHNRVDFFADYDNKIIVNASLRSRVFWGDVIRLNESFSEQIERGNNDQWDMSLHVFDHETWLFNTTVDRLNIIYQGDKFDLTIGRQRINWGINTFWNPNDLFNAYSFVDFDYQERPGSDALHFQYYYDDQQSFEIATNQFDYWDEAIVAGKWNTNVGSYDVQILTAYYLDNIVFGGGWAGNLKNASFKGEMAYFHDLKDNGRNGFSITAGVDHVLKNGLLIGGGMLFNDLGQNDASFAELLEFNLTAKNLYPYKWTGYINAQYSVNPLLNVGGSIIYSPGEHHPVFFSPVFTYSMASNWDIDLTSQWLFQEDDTFKLNVALAYLRTRWSF